MECEKIEPHVAAAGFATLAVILIGEVLLILGATPHEMPLSPLAQLVSARLLRSLKGIWRRRASRPRFQAAFC